MPGVRIKVAPAAAKEADYRVSFAGIRTAIGFIPRRTVADGVAEIAETIVQGIVPDFRDARYSNYKALMNGDAMAALARTGLPAARVDSAAG